MNFVESGAKALALMEQIPFDVIVSDMQMPGMNGAQLLNEVMSRHPHMVRIVLSGHADKELILACVGATHQYLSKPCDPDLLRTTILQAFDLTRSLDSERLRRLISQVQNLPSLPLVYTELLRELESPRSTTQRVSDIVAKDMGLTSQMLKLTNSAYFGLRRKVSTPSEAIGYLGLETIKSLALANGVFSRAIAGPPRSFPVERLWSHSIAVAEGMRRLMRNSRMDPKLASEAYVVGLLHDCGILILESNFPEAYPEVRRLMGPPEQLSFIEAEFRVLGATHAEAGAYLLGLWGLPAPVVEAVKLHHDSLPSLSESPLRYLVHAAEAHMDTLLEGQQLDPLAENWLDLDDRVPGWRDLLSHTPVEGGTP